MVQTPEWQNSSIIMWVSFPGEKEPSRRNLPWGRQFDGHVTQVSCLLVLLFNSLTLTRRLERGRFTIGTVWNGHLCIVPMCSPQSPRSQLQKQNICLKKALVRPDFFFLLLFPQNAHISLDWMNILEAGMQTWRVRTHAQACLAMLQGLTSFPWMLGFFFCQDSSTSGILSVAGFPAFRTEPW